MTFCKRRGDVSAMMIKV